MPRAALAKIAQAAHTARKIAAEAQSKSMLKRALQHQSPKCKIKHAHGI